MTDNSTTDSSVAGNSTADPHSRIGMAHSWISIAHLVRPQGRRGEILADILTDFPERFAQMREAFLARSGNDRPLPVAIEAAWLHKGRVVLKLAKIDSISAAEAVRGADLVIPAQERMSLPDDAAYIDDLIGCAVIDRNQSGQPSIGTIRDVIRQDPAADMLVVVSAAGLEHWIPFAKAYLVRIDLPGRRVEMNLPCGLLDVNAPLNEEERRRAQAADSTPE